MTRLQVTTAVGNLFLTAIAAHQSVLAAQANVDRWQVFHRSVHALVDRGAGIATPIVRIATLRRHRLVVPVPENDGAGVPEGTQLDFTVPAFPRRLFHAPIARIAHEVDIKTRTMSVELDVADPHAELVRFAKWIGPERRTYPTLFVPVSAVASNLESTFTVRINKRRAEWVEVKTGVSTGNWIEAFGDLHEGTKF